MTVTPEAAQSPSPDQGPLPVLKGRYVLGRELGRGGMSTVLQATDTVLNRQVAVKLLQPQLSREPAFVEQFLEMERRIARLFHPNLVTIFDAGADDDGACFVVMECVSGGSARDRSAREGQLPIDDVVQIIAQTAQALQMLHEERIIHGDVKPDNILLDGEGNAKLVDFGIARIATTTGVVDPARLAGTTPYLAPEQLEHGPADHRSDIYALGLVAYELLAGRRAFEGDNWIAVVTQRLERDPDPLSQLRPDVPHNVEQAINRAIARDPAERFSSADAFRQALLAEWAPELEPTRALPRVEESPTEAERPEQRAAADGTDEPPADYSNSWRTRLPRPATARLSQRATLLALAAVGLLVLVGVLLLPRVLNPPRPVGVPQLAGQNLETVRVAAGRAGLSLSLTHEASETGPPGMVLRQDPAANTTLQSDQPVKLVVSTGPPPVKVPDLAGRRMEDARKDLAAIGLGLGKVDQREVTKEPWGTIVEQSTRPGAELARGGSIDVVVGLAPARSTPRLLDRALGDAEAELEKQGLRLGVVDQEPTRGKRAGTVMAQNPAPDVRLREGESVAVTISIPVVDKP